MLRSLHQKLTYGIIHVDNLKNKCFVTIFCKLIAFIRFSFAQIGGWWYIHNVEATKQGYLEINKSKFYSFLYDVTNIEQIESILADLRVEYKKATHICYAYILSSPSMEKRSDDGEPSGTAGLPIMTMLKRKKMTNVLAVVVRYFGGKKLGAGGLIRAYTHAVADIM